MVNSLNSLKRPRTFVRSNRAELMLFTPSNRKVVLPGTEHVTRAELEGCNPGTAPCDAVKVWFAAPPAANVAMVVDRIALFTPVAAEALERSLYEKWGTPSWQIREDHGEVGSRTFSWIWDKTGHLRAPIASSKTLPCGTRFTFVDTPPIDAKQQAPAAEEMLERGCARAIHVRYTIRNGIVKESSLKAFDAAVAKSSIEQTERFVADARQRELARDREAVSGNALPRN